MRQCLVEEFSNLYILHLRGNQRTSGERSRKEGGKIFGSGSRAPIAISILVKNPEAKVRGNIYFHDIGDYLTREQKLKTIADFGSIEGITRQKGWQEIEPDQFGDWLNQRDPNFDTYISLGDKKNKIAEMIFENYSSGVKTNRDAWVYNASLDGVKNTTEAMVAYFNKSVEEYKNLCKSEIKENWPDVERFLDFNTKTISWTLELKQDLARQTCRTYNPEGLRKALYRPFTKSWMFFDRHFNSGVYQMHKIFPTKDSDNLVISVTGRGAIKEFSVLITNVTPDLEMISKGQCFPLYSYEKTPKNTSLFGQAEESEYQRRDAITDEALAYFQSAYPQARISKEDIFYYIYGLLHSEDYRERYADNLSKQLPRIPCVKTAADFWAFSQAGCDLAYLHLNYETVPLYTGAHLSGSLKYLKVTEQKVLGGEDADFYVTKMKFARKDDKTSVIYNNKITIQNIPEEAYDYVINGKPALDWVVERQGVRTDKASGIINDTNDWAIETMNNARYPLELFLRVITVSLKSQVIVNGLPKLTTQAVALNQSSLLQENRFATGL